VQTAGAIRPATLGAWSLVAIIINMMLVPLNALIPAFYAKNTAVSLGTIGVVLLVARLYDAFADPAVGFLSDITRSPLGARKPWILAGAIAACVATVLLYNPAPTATGAYFLPVMLLFYTAYTMMSVPHSAWGAELSRAQSERSMISGVLTFVSIAGVLIFMGLPILLSSPLVPMFRTSEITPPMLRLLGWLILAMTPICVLIPVLFVPRGAPLTSERSTLLGAMSSVRGNRPFGVFMAAYALTGLAYGVYYGASYLFLDSYLGLADKFPIIFATVAIAQMVSIPLWTRLLARVERHHMWAAGLVVFALLLPAHLFLPRHGQGFALLLVLVVLGNFANAASQTPQMAVLADCIDYDCLRTGGSRAATYYAVQSFVLKATLAAGGGLAFLVLGAFHFDAKAKAQTHEGLVALMAVSSIAPTVLFFAAAACLWTFPLNSRRQGVIRHALERRAAANA
jgi:Na+/melibiose symporter-like transporter